MVDKRDYYEILGIAKDASQADIKRAYRRLAREHHPDVNPNDPEAEARFKEINEAYQVLSDSEKRSVYDRYGHRGMDQSYGQDFGGFSDFGGFGDIFDMFFGGGASGAARTRPSAERGNDLRYDVELSLEEAARGVEHTVKYSRMESCDTCHGSGAKPGTQPETCSMCGGSGQVRQQQQTIFGTQVRIGACPRCKGEGRVISAPCPECSGQGRVRRSVEKKVDIPAGVDTGMQIRLSGGGDAGLRGGPSGDLYIFMHVRKHPIFERRGNDLWCKKTISFACAALGGTLDVKTIDGTEEMEVDSGTQFGEVYTLRGKGMPDPTSGRRGDLNVAIEIETPSHLNDEQKTLLRQFAASRGEDIRPTRGKSIFERVKDAFK